MRAKFGLLLVFYFTAALSRDSTHSWGTTPTNDDDGKDMHESGRMAAPAGIRVLFSLAARDHFKTTLVGKKLDKSALLRAISIDRVHT